MHLRNWDPHKNVPDIQKVESQCNADPNMIGKLERFKTDRPKKVFSHDVPTKNTEEFDNEKLMIYTRNLLFLKSLHLN